MKLPDNMQIPFEEWNLQTPDQKQQFLVTNRIYLHSYLNKDKKGVPAAIEFRKYDPALKIVPI
jgi:hypothetical protein